MRKHDMYGNSAVANLGDRSATINIAEKWEGAAVPLSVEGYGSPSNTMSPRPRSTSTPTGILIHPAVWPQQTWAEECGLLCPFPLGQLSWVVI